MPSSSNKPKRVITERDVIQAWQEHKTQLLVPTGGLITPAARDAARVKKIALVDSSQEKKPAEPARKPPESLLASAGAIALGSDHGGYALKEQLKDHLRSLGYRFDDVGTFSEAPVDYADIAELVAQKVASGTASRGIVIDGAGVGSAMAANKIPGVRAAACYDTYTAKNSREHNNANVLSLGSRNLGIDIVKEIVKVWLETGFGGGRHLKRVEKIMALEQKYFRGK
ncbi:MAG: ribose 5-phosphate isomerase B [candidate division KSB1 bacterium]